MKRVQLAVMLAAVALVTVAHLWGRVLFEADPRIAIPTPPFLAQFRPRIGPGTFLAMAVATLVLTVGHKFAARVDFKRLLAAAFFVALGWAVSLALVDGVHALTAPLETRFDYLTYVHLVDQPGDFLRTFAERIPTFEFHVKSHPPGMLIFLWLLDAVGLQGAGIAAAVVLLVGSSAVVAVLISVRELAGEGFARKAAPFVSMAPAAVWVATSADGFFAGVGAWAITFVVLATGSGSTTRPRRARFLFALIGGVLFGFALFLSYGLVLLAPIAIMPAIFSKEFRKLLVAALGTVVVVVGIAAAGFSWVDGLASTIEAQAGGVYRYRPYAYFLVANLAVLAAMIGPAAITALSGLRSARLWLVSGPALAVLMVANLSGFSRGEVERVWLPFVFWLLPAAATLRSRRIWLGAQIATGLILQSLLLTPW